LVLLHHQGEATQIVMTIVIVVPVPVVAIESTIIVPPQVEAVAVGQKYAFCRPEHHPSNIPTFKIKDARSRYGGALRVEFYTETLSP